MPGAMDLEDTVAVLIKALKECAAPHYGPPAGSPQQDDGAITKDFNRRQIIAVTALQKVGEWRS